MVRLLTLVIVAIAFICTIEGFTSKSAPIGKACKPVHCEGKLKNCPYGFRKQDGCEICKCHDPCNPTGKAVLCGPHKRCFVVKKSNGTFGTRCDSVKSHKHKRTICEQEKEPGLCMAAMRKFYYNKDTKKCEQFLYGGCGGNSNNFETLNECKSTCEI